MEKMRKFQFKKFVKGLLFTQKMFKGQFLVALSGCATKNSLPKIVFSCLIHHKMMEFYQGQYIIAIDEKEIENYKKNKECCTNLFEIDLFHGRPSPRIPWFSGLLLVFNINKSKIKGNRIHSNFIKWTPKDWSKRGRW